MKAQLARLKAWQSSEIYRAEMEDAFHEAQAAREAARNLFAPTPPIAQAEYLPPELC